MAATEEMNGGVALMQCGGVMMSLKWISLIVLILQNTILVLAMRYSRTYKDADQPLFLITTAVVMSEFIKLVISLIALVAFPEYRPKLSPEDEAKHGDAPNTPWWLGIKAELLHKDMLKLAVPGVLYTAQNNLLFVALSNLPVAVYQVTYQLKIISTAIMSVVLFQRSLNRSQIVSLVLLTTGVAMVQMSNSSNSSYAKNDQAERKNALMGLTCVLCACLTSGFAGVYMEKVLKTGRPVSLFMRNVQLGLFGIVLGLCGVCGSDWAEVRENGFFQGYNNIVWFVIVVQAGGGILIAVVMKYADNILKGFATSISIVLSTCLSALLFGFSITQLFAGGALMVIFAVFLYSYKPREKAYIPIVGS